MWWIAGMMAATLITPAVSGEQELALGNWWIDAALLGKEVPAPVMGAGLEVVQQTHGTFRLNKSVWNESMRIGNRGYVHGLGTHSISEIRVALPRPGKRFRAAIGIDANPNTAGWRGSAVFVVEGMVGRECFRSAVLRGGSKPQKVDVRLGGASKFTLRVLDGGDGPAHDQADWADARVELDDGSVLYLDELSVLRGPTQPSIQLPFSFTYGGQPSRELLPRWTRRVDEEEGGSVHRISYVDPETALRVTCIVRRLEGFPAVDWVLEFANEGDDDSPLLERGLPLDLTVNMPPGELVQLHHARGSTCEISDFLHIETPLKPGGRVDLAPAGGRSSNGTLPFFNIHWGNGGTLVGIGWSGQWKATIKRETPSRLRLSTGMETMRLKLHPGERIRTPRVLLVSWQGTDRLRGHNLLRRLMLNHYCPRVNGELIIPPVAHPTSASILMSGKGANERTQLDSLRAAADIGCEAFWLDAYWFPRGFPGGVGTWTPRSEDFPNGLRPLSNAAHKAGMKFVLWFEPERVARGSQIAAEHPEYCLEAGGGDLLFNLAMPEAREFMTDLLSKAIEEHGVDIYREDFNIDPLRFWRAADESDRQGVTEIRWIEGLYKMWDELLERHPGLAIDNCASGGRRIDVETASRSYALWRSDFQDIGVLRLSNYLGKAAIANQVQTVGLGLYVPFSAGALWSFDPYSFRSAMAAGGVPAYMDLRDQNLDRRQARAAIAELKELRQYFLGDLYPLMPVTTSPVDWCACQFDRPALGGGIALFFRREQSPYLAISANLKAIDPSAQYEWATMTDYGEHEWQTISGAELAVARVEIAEVPGSLLLRYRKAR